MGRLWLCAVGTPDLVGESSALAFNMLVRTGSVQARIESARRLKMRELAVLSRTVRPIPAERHIWVFKGAFRVCAVRKVSTNLLCLVDSLLGR